MHIHILGISGTFMGGMAAIAMQAGHRVTGCDTQVYPPMSDQLRALGIDLIEGYSRDQARIGADIFVIGNVVTPRQTTPDGRNPQSQTQLHFRPAMAGGTRAQETSGLWR